jgi:hypothetical protein
MVSLKLLCSSAADDELIDAWLSVRGLQIAREAPRSKGGRLGLETCWDDRPGPISAQFVASFTRCCFPSLLDPSPFCMWALVVSFSQIGRSPLSRKIQHFFWLGVLVQVKNKCERSLPVRPPGVWRRQVGFVRGTWWPAGSSASRMMARIIR